MPRYSSSYSRYSSASPATTGIRESAITWSSSGGHNHDGDNASLIDFERYTVFDFGLNPIFTTNNRSIVQDRNIVSFENYVVDIISRNTITPQSIIINNDTFINGENISVRTITTNQLATDAIQSLNFDYSSGLYSDSGSFFNLADGVIRTPSMFLNSSGDLYLSNSVVIGATSASDVVSGAAAGANAIPTGGAANDVNTGNTTVEGTQITANSITTNQIATNAIKSNNYIAPSSGAAFSTSGTFLNLSGGDFISTGFSAYSNGSVYISNTATIGSTTASTVVSGAAAGANAIPIGGAASDVNDGETNISGGKIRTGEIESTGFVRGSGTYSTTGTRIDLDDGQIISEQFRIDNTGSAFFKGSLQAASGSLASFNITSTALTTDGTSSGTVGGGDASSYSTTGYITVQNYGDIFIGSSPTTGSYTGEHHKTNITGEYVNIRQTTSNSYNASTGVYSHFGRSSYSSQTNYMAVAMVVEPTAYANNLYNYSRLSSSDVESEVQILWSDNSDSYKAIMNADSVSAKYYLYNGSTLAFVATTNDASGGYVQVGSTSTNYFRIRANGYITGSDPVISGGLTASGDILAKNLTANTAVSGGSGTFSGLITTGSLTSNTFVNGDSITASTLLQTSSGPIKAQNTTYGNNWNDQQLQVINSSGDAGLAIRATNNLGTVQIRVGAGNPTAYFRGSGTGYSNIDAGNIYSNGSAVAVVSSKTIKENIVNLSNKYNSIELINSINPVTFNYIKEHSQVDSNRIQIGFIAEDLEAVFPESVIKSFHNKSYTAGLYLDSMAIAALSVQAIKDLSKEVDNLKKQIKDLS